MARPLSHQIAERVVDASQLYHRLVLVVGPSRSGKTAALRELKAEHGWPLINLNLLLSERLLELTARQRALRVARLVGEILNEKDAEIVLLDNIEMLFHPGLKQDPLRLLQSLSRNRTIVAVWCGAIQGRSLIYATPDHPEFRRLDDPQALIVLTHTGDSVAPPTASAQEHSA